MRFPDAELTTIDVLRHGEPLGGRRMRGKTDHPLSDIGWQQMHRAVAAASTQGELPWDCLITSPLRRCREFALWLGEQHGIPVVTDPMLAEMSLGDWEDKTHAEVRDTAAEPDRLARFWQDPHLVSPPDGESLEALDDRVAHAWQQLLDQPPGDHLLVICHLFVSNAILRQVLGQPLNRTLRFDLPYASSSRIRHERHYLGQSSFVEWVGARAP